MKNSKEEIVLEKPFKKNNIPVVFSANDNFVPYMSVAIQSIIDTSKTTNNYDINILHSSIKPESEKILMGMVKKYKNFNIRFINVIEYINNLNLYTENRKNFTQEAYYRLLIPNIFKKYEKVVYLDGDMVILKDVADLYNENMEGYALASSRDLWGTCNCYMPGENRREYRESIGLDNIEDYFISGMLIFNIQEIRKLYTVDYIMKLAVSRKWLQHDQDVLNVLFKGKTKLLPANWDFMSDYGNCHYLPEKLLKEYYDAEKDPYIMHFGGVRKPWLRAYIEYDLLFWKCALKTPYFEYLFKSIQGKNEYKCYLVKKLFEEGLSKRVEKEDIILLYKDLFQTSISNFHTSIQIMRFEKGILRLEGSSIIVGLDEENVETFVEANGEMIKSEPVIGDMDKYRDEDIIYRGVKFKFNIPMVSKKCIIKFFVKIGDIFIEKKVIKFEKHCPLTNKLRKSFYYKDNYLFTYDKKSIIVKKTNGLVVLKNRALLIANLLKEKEPGYKMAALYRICYALVKPFMRKEIWLFSDRTNRADDNGEALFDYVNSLKVKNRKIYFILRKDSPDYLRMKEKGNVIEYLSFKHKILHLLCEMNISSQADMPCIYPFRVEEKNGLANLLVKQKYIFLQHGIINTDISRWFNYYNLNCSIFCTSTKKEYDGIIENVKYGLNGDVLKLTGLARHDRLYHDEQKLVTVMPTWRKFLTYRTEAEKGVWMPRNEFKISEYLKFYNSLLNNEKLLKAAKGYGYRIQFMPHPNIVSAMHFFDKNEDVMFSKVDTKYSEIFAKSNLVVTDYSSAVMDFAYLRKPIFYCQFDKDEFFSGGHIAGQGSFNYEEEGFGEVEYTLEDTINRMIEYMKNDCKLKDKYRKRIDNFFEYNDSKNSERIYNEILKL